MTLTPKRPIYIKLQPFQKLFWKKEKKKLQSPLSENLSNIRTLKCFLVIKSPSLECFYIPEKSVGGLNISLHNVSKSCSALYYCTGTEPD